MNPLLQRVLKTKRQWSNCLFWAEFLFVSERNEAFCVCVLESTENALLLLMMLEGCSGVLGGWKVPSAGQYKHPSSTQRGKLPNWENPLDHKMPRPSDREVQLQVYLLHCSRQPLAVLPVCLLLSCSALNKSDSDHSKWLLWWILSLPELLAAILFPSLPFWWPRWRLLWSLSPTLHWVVQ